MRKSFKPVTASLGAAFLATAVSPMASADVNPFSANTLSNGYELVNAAGHAEGKCGEGKCGEGKCGEGKCGEGKDHETKDGEGKCGEGKCGEGKCGEGKCGS